GGGGGGAEGGGGGRGGAPRGGEPAAAPGPAPSIAAPPAEVPAPPAPRSFGRYLGAGILTAVGVALAGVGMVETTAYAAGVGGLMFASLAVCADALVLVMPAALVALWHRRSPAAILAAALWLVGATLPLAHPSGYRGSRDDYFPARTEPPSDER